MLTVVHLEAMILQSKIDIEDYERTAAMFQALQATFGLDNNDPIIALESLIAKSQTIITLAEELLCRMRQ